MNQWYHDSIIIDDDDLVMIGTCRLADGVKHGVLFSVHDAHRSRVTDSNPHPQPTITNNHTRKIQTLIHSFVPGNLGNSS
jgi:hypothetical protein